MKLLSTLILSFFSLNLIFTQVSCSNTNHSKVSGGGYVLDDLDEELSEKQAEEIFSQLKNGNDEGKQLPSGLFRSRTCSLRVIPARGGKGPQLEFSYIFKNKLVKSLIEGESFKGDLGMLFGTHEDDGLNRRHKEIFVQNGMPTKFLVKDNGTSELLTCELTAVP